MSPSHPRAITTILTRAAERGEIRPDQITPRIARLPGDLLRYEMMHHPGDAAGTVLAEILLPLVGLGESVGESRQDR